jgi:hypothetical protein
MENQLGDLPLIVLLEADLSVYRFVNEVRFCFRENFDFRLPSGLGY